MNPNKTNLVDAFYILNEMNTSSPQKWNVSSCLVEHCWIRIEEEIQPHTLKCFDALFAIVTVLLLVFGVPLNLAVIHYEKFGGDTQKRSLNNRFTSYAMTFAMTESISLQVFVALVR